MLSKDLLCDCKILYRDRLGRCLMVRLVQGDWSMIICNVYFPTADHEGEQIDMLFRIEDHLNQYLGENICIVGDFNVVLNWKLETYNLVGHTVRNPNFRNELNAFLENFSLCDPWRIRHWEKKIFTWSRANKGSRLDYIFISECCLNQVGSTSCSDVAFSDHRIITTSFNPSQEGRGKGFWRINTYLLEKEEIFEEVSVLIEQKKEEHAELSGTLKCELIKFHVRECLLHWQARLRKERNAEQKDLEKKIEELQDLLGRDGVPEELMEQQLDLLNALKRELYALQMSGERIKLLKSRTQWAMYGGKPTKFFLNLEKQNCMDKSIEQLFNEEVG